MYNAFWRHALFERGQSFSVKTFDRSRSDCQVIRLGAGDDFRGPSGQALPLPLRVSFSRARFFLCPLLPSACYAGYKRAEKTCRSGSRRQASNAKSRRSLFYFKPEKVNKFEYCNIVITFGNKTFFITHCGN